jgi:integrase
MLVTSLDHLHAKVREALKMPADFVVHSLRHTMLTRLGMLGVDAFTIMKIAGHSSITISQRYVHVAGVGRARLREAGSIQPGASEDRGGHRIGHRQQKCGSEKSP